MIDRSFVSDLPQLLNVPSFSSFSAAVTSSSCSVSTMEKLGAAMGDRMIVLVKNVENIMISFYSISESQVLPKKRKTPSPTLSVI